MNHSPNNTMIIHNVEQRSPEWFELRVAKATASEFFKIVTGTGKRSSSWESYMGKLTADSEIGDTEETPLTYAMKHGIELEPHALQWFRDNVAMAQEVGFVTNDDLPGIGCSPDGLIEDGDNWIAGLEIKSPTSRGKHVSYVMGDEIPAAYRQQVHGSMAVTGLKSWYFLSYYARRDNPTVPLLEPFVLRVEADDYTATMRRELSAFSELYRERHPIIAAKITRKKPQ